LGGKISRGQGAKRLGSKKCRGIGGKNGENNNYQYIITT
jgi:hypothetical protein